jgi:hypothetical protein
MRTDADRVLWAAGLTALAGFVALLVWYLPGTIPLTHVSGIMTAWARDIVQGEFYRPLYDGRYFGGTRYMPLFPLLHAGLMGLLHDPVLAGRLLMLASLLAFDAGLLALMKSQGVRTARAVPLVMTAHASILFMLIGLDVKCDFLAAGLNLWGLAWALAYGRTGRKVLLFLASLAFTAAVMTKLSTLFGLCAVCVFLWKKGRPALAGRLLLFTVILMVVAFAVVGLASGGRLIEAFCALASEE